ncbi:MAG: hypothetical protein PW786_08920 [Arachidicoccus sp.]|nr:hypothetical protein [Arachidicoccus sp.]
MKKVILGAALILGGAFGASAKGNHSDSKVPALVSFTTTCGTGPYTVDISNMSFSNYLALTRAVDVYDCGPSEPTILYA